MGGHTNEIEITPEMIEAGFDPIHAAIDEVSESKLRECVARIYRVMECARRRYPPQAV
jgi:hypothetical protein